MIKVSLLTILVSASELFSIEPQRKIRVSHRDVHVAEEAIYVQTDGEWKAFKALFRDDEGFYVRGVYEEQNGLIRWLCDCGEYNFQSEKICHYCKRGRYDYKNELKKDTSEQEEDE